MVLEIEKKNGPFKTKQIWFADFSYNVIEVDRVIFRDCKKKDDKEFNCENFTTLIIDLTQDLDAIWKKMDKSSCRYSIGRAERDGIKIKINQGFNDFVKINNSFRRKKGLTGENLNIGFIKKYGTLFISEFNGEIIGGQVFLEDKNNMRWLIGASKRLEKNKERAILIGNANRLLIWEAIKYAKAKGIKEFDFGGYLQDSNDRQKMNISIFKKSFGGELATHYVCRKDYSKIYKLISRVLSFIKK